MTTCPLCHCPAILKIGRRLHYQHETASQDKLHRIRLALINLRLQERMLKQNIETENKDGINIL